MQHQSEATEFEYTQIRCPKCGCVREVLHAPKHREYCPSCQKWSAPEKWVSLGTVTKTKTITLCFDDE